MNSKKSLSEVHESVKIPEKRGLLKTLLSFLGPAYLISVGYMDPGNWATDIAGGSRFGYQLIWVLLMSNVMALILQSLSARLGIVKGLDLAQASRQQYSKFANYGLYALAEIAIAACDLAEIIGMAIGLNLLFDIPLLYGVLITIADTFLLMYILQKGMRMMEAFILALITIIGISFFIQLFIVKPELNAIAKGFIPQLLHDDALYIAIGIIGATVMPHNLYLHSALVQTRKFGRDEKGIKQAIKFNFIDTTVALNLAFLVNAAILVLAASAFYKNGYDSVVDITDAHKLLKGIFGSFAPALFAIALIAAGQSSTITGTFAGQIVMEGYLNLRISPWMRRIITRLIAVIPTLLTILYFGEHELGNLLILSQVMLSIQLGFAIIPLIHFTSSKWIMGKFKITVITQVVAWTVALIIVGLNIKLVIDELTAFSNSSYGSNTVLNASIYLFIVLVSALLLYIAFEPIVIRIRKEKHSIPHGKAKPLSHFEYTNYTNIAIAIDFREQDEATIYKALSLGKKEAIYTLIHIAESAGSLRLGEDVSDYETQFDWENLQSYQNDLTRNGYQVNIRLGFGRPDLGIYALVEEIDADILVMGAHGHGSIKDLIFGSTTDKVRHLVNIPVLIIK